MDIRIRAYSWKSLRKERNFYDARYKSVFELLLQDRLSVFEMISVNYRLTDGAEERFSRSVRNETPSMPTVSFGYHLDNAQKHRQGKWVEVELKRRRLWREGHSKLSFRYRHWQTPRSRYLLVRDLSLRRQNTFRRLPNLRPS